MAPEAAEDVAVATLEMALEAEDDVAVSVGRRPSLTTGPVRMASSSLAITVEFAVVFNQADYILREFMTELRGLRCLCGLLPLRDYRRIDRRGC